YELIALDVDATFDDYPDDESRMKAIASELLDRWQALDEQLWREAGLVVPPGGLGYRANESQARWARVHAEVINEAVRRKRAYEAERQQDPSLPEKSYATFVEELGA